MFPKKREKRLRNEKHLKYTRNIQIQKFNFIIANNIKSNKNLNISLTRLRFAPLNQLNADCVKNWKFTKIRTQATRSQSYRNHWSFFDSLQSEFCLGLEINYLKFLYLLLNWIFWIFFSCKQCFDVPITYDFDDLNVHVISIISSIFRLQLTISFALVIYGRPLIPRLI